MSWKWTGVCVVEMRRSIVITMLFLMAPMLTFGLAMIAWAVIRGLFGSLARLAGPPRGR